MFAKFFSTNLSSRLEKQCYSNLSGLEQRNMTLLLAENTKKGRPPVADGPSSRKLFHSYDNPHTICQNLPESAVTSAEAEEGQCE
jgi:hypothetical protein